MKSEMRRRTEINTTDCAVRSEVARSSDDIRLYRYALLALLVTRGRGKRNVTLDQLRRTIARSRSLSRLFCSLNSGRIWGKEINSASLVPLTIEVALPASEFFGKGEKS